MHARNVSGEHLEVLGKQAAARWESGEYKTLTDSVTSMVKAAHLSPEQVKRVIEFANTAAYLGEFKKEGNPNRVIEFHGGPADPSEILKDLNDGGGGTVFDSGNSDYNFPPKEASEKTASSHDEGALAMLFGSTAPEPLPYENPLSEAISLKDKLAGYAAHLQSEMSGLEIAYAELGSRVYHEVKQASLAGVPLGHILQAWEQVAPSNDYIKVAFELMTPRLLREEVFRSLEQMTASVDKTASARALNVKHPLIAEFQEFCETLNKLAEARETREEALVHVGHLDTFIKKASTLGEIYGAANKGARRAADAATPFVSKHVGETAGKVVGKAIDWSPQLAIAAAANEAHTHLKHDPALAPVRAAGNFALQQVPGTKQNIMHKYEVESGQ